MPQLRTQNNADAGKGNGTILAWSKSKIAWLCMWDVGGSQTIKKEAHRSVVETCQRWVGARSRIATVKPAKTHSQNRYKERFVKPQVVARAIWKGYREKEIRAFTDMIMCSETAKASKGPGRCDAINHSIDIGEQKESTLFRPEGTDKHAAKETPERGHRPPLPWID
jgi:hypothetical protein